MKSTPLQKIYFLLLTVVIFSCKQAEKKSQPNLKNTPIVNQIVFDSLDADKKENYITSNFPKNVNDTIYLNSLKRQWELIKATFDYNQTFDINYFKEQAAKNEFILDTKDLEELAFSRRDFNKRQFIILSGLSNKKFKYQIQCLYWYDKQKYFTAIEFEFAKQSPKNLVWDF
jgi:hypothetical protein